MPVIESDWAIRLCKMLEFYVMLEANAVDAEVDLLEKVYGGSIIVRICDCAIIFMRWMY